MEGFYIELIAHNLESKCDKNTGIILETAGRIKAKSAVKNLRSFYE
ncbi:hypothetical protein AC062_1473 [Pasteurellaceae bacterium NI1060]|nr:hypothetical protein AC062_1473 [Pasteurellaceae bacterium NI1060]